MKKPTRQPMLCALALAALSLSGCTAQAQAPQDTPQNAPAAADVADAGAPVTLLKTPNEGIQPQAVMDAQGALHLIYFKGKPMSNISVVSNALRLRGFKVER